MIRSEIFWTDIQQANERLTGTIILYDNTPYYVTEAFEGDDGKPRVNMVSCCPKQVRERKLMDSPKFNRFRTLPKIGWVNPSTGGSAFFLERVAKRTRLHGLADSNTMRRAFVDGSLRSSERGSITLIMNDTGFGNCVKGAYPSLVSILGNIAENSALAYSRRYCVYRDEHGIRWLYRDHDRIGLFTGAETLFLLTKYAFYREEIMADPAFTLDRIQEF